MNKKEFLRELSFRLIFMKKDDKQAILDYYSEMIDDYVEDGYTEEEAVLKLGSIKSIIKNIKESKDNEDSIEYIEKKLEFKSEGITNISLTALNRKIKIEKSNDELIHLEYSESEKDYINIEIIDNKLNIENVVEKQNGINFIINKIIDTNIILYIPESFIYDLYICTKNSAIISECELNLTNGSFITTNGTLNIQNVSSTNDLLFTTTNGAIKLSKISAENINIKSTNGAIKLEKIDSKEQLNMSTTNGSVNFDNIISSKEIKIKTANGSIKGTIGEEQSTYSIESHTVNGRNNLSNIVLDSDKKLIVETANGSINIQFKE